LSSGFTNPSGFGLGEFSVQALQFDSLTVSSSNPANTIGTLWFKIGVQVSANGNSGLGASGSVSIGPAGPGIVSTPISGGQVWGQSFCEAGTRGPQACGSLTVESPHFGIRFGKAIILSYGTMATNGLGVGNTTATATISTTILGIYVLDANGNQLTSGVTVSSVLGGTYNVITTPLSSNTALPHFAAGGAWTTGFNVVNTGAQPANFSVAFFDDMGELVPVQLSTGGGYSTFSGTVPALGSTYFEAGIPQVPLVSGWVQITADPSITVQELLRNNANGTYYEAGVPSGSGSLEFVVPFDATTFAPTGAPLYTGLAIANLDSENTANIVCTALNSAGVAIPNAITVPPLTPLGHWADYLFPALTGQRGSIDCVSNTKIAALALRFIGTNAFSTLPVIMK
jgi:hypothetical protein